MSTEDSAGKMIWDEKAVLVAISPEIVWAYISKWSCISRWRNHFLTDSTDGHRF